jgi:hypothetical protein
LAKTGAAELGKKSQCDFFPQTVLALARFSPAQGKPREAGCTPCPGCPSTISQNAKEQHESETDSG